MVVEGITSALHEHPEVEVVGQAHNGREAVRKVEKLRPDIVIMDLSMPDLNGIDATFQIKKSYPRTHVIIFTMHSDKEYVIDLLKAGISAYVLKEDSMSELIHAIQTVTRGKVYLSSSAPDVFDDPRNTYGSTDTPKSGFKTLSLREREVLQLLAEGNAIKDIAGKLDLSPKTVESHKYNIMAKLGARNVVDLTKIAIKKKLVQF